MSSSSLELADDVQHQQVTQSTILLLLQEATKLTPPADDERSRPGPSRAESQDSGSLVLSVSKDSEFTGSFSIVRESDQRSSSAWEVMHLINQQCERLLRSPFEQEDPTVPCGRVPSDTCFSVIYCSETANELTDVEEIKEADDLAELIKTHSADHVGAGEKTENEPGDECPSDRHESVVPSAGSDCLPVCPLDFTSCLVSERDADGAWLPLNASENTQSSSRPADLNNNLTGGVSKELVQTGSWEAGRRTQRKQPRPSRSPDPRDTDTVQGVTFSMYPELDADRSRLIITSNYSEEIRRLRRSRSSRCRSQRTSSSEEESDSCGLSRSKICASCRTRKTPLWRDAEDGTPLCNACGIRYKKYRVRCQQCWNIPKKEANTNSKCLKCGDVLKMKCSSW
ncbi:hypothetical protein QQF64_029333 [Cirrhinus molitorella]|uniref:GATA-type domain-containing protein n=1 Tax=Cirrhinus molitorella TaxID=172907 RepID=A0ABR3N9Q6_9TELE